jgi:hypothetical protein
MPRNPTAGTDIDAPLDAVWDVMLDTARYAEWNPFLRRIECPSPPSVGDPIHLHVVFPGRSREVTSPERISLVDHPHDDGDGVRRATLAYDYEGLPAKLGLIRGRRYQRLTQEPGSPTRYETVEEFSGPLVFLAGPGRVEAGFKVHAGALRTRCESPR